MNGISRLEGSRRVSKGFFLGFGLLAVAVAALGCGGQVPGAPDTTRLAEVNDDVQASYTNASVNGSATYGTITANYDDSTGVKRTAEGSCGVTFISHHYAITAAHCVGHHDYQTTYEVDQIDTTNLNLTGTAFANSMKLTGTVDSNGVPHWTPVHVLSPSDGYVTHALSCTTIFRCAAIDGPTPVPNCTTPPANVADQKDIALIYCASRPGRTYWTVNTSDPTSGAVVALWYHEVYDAPITPLDQLHTQGNWNNYGCFQGTTTGCSQDAAHNFHYSNVMNAKLLPIRSATRPGNINYQISTLPGSAGPDTTWTDLVGCHGTSGSNVFMNGTSSTLGPALNPGTPYEGRLCADMTNAPRNGQNTSFGNAKYTRALENYVLQDR